MVTPDQQRAAADYLSERYKVSQRRISRVMARPRSILRYRCSRGTDDQPLIREIKRLARRHPRFGYRRIHALLVRGGWSVNLKRVRRLWNSLGLRRPLRLRKARKLGPKPGTSANSCVQQPARFKNDVWTCDSDGLGNGSLVWGISGTVSVERLRPPFESTLITRVSEAIGWGAGFLTGGIVALVLSFLGKTRKAGPQDA